MKTKLLNLYEHSDHKHSWLAVKRTLVDEILGLKNVSPYSFQKGKTVYLEWHRDASNFIKASKDKHYTICVRSLKIRTTSPVREYEAFKLEENEKQA